MLSRRPLITGSRLLARRRASHGTIALALLGLVALSLSGLPGMRVGPTLAVAGAPGRATQTGRSADTTARVLLAGGGTTSSGGVERYGPVPATWVTHMPTPTPTATPTSNPCYPPATPIGSGSAGSAVTIAPDVKDGGTWQATYWLFNSNTCSGDTLMAGNGYDGTCADDISAYPLTCYIPSDAPLGTSYIRTETNNHNAGYYLSFNVTSGAPTPTPTNTPTPAVSIAVSPTQVSPSQPLTVTGSGFGTREAVSVYWDFTSNPPLTTTTTAADGSFAAHVHAPQAVYGSHTVIAVGHSSARSAQAPVSIVAGLQLMPDAGAPGATITVQGGGFGGTEPVSVHWGSPGGPLLVRTSSNAAGSIGRTAAVTFAAPAGPAGRYHVYAVGGRTHVRASALFTLT